MCNFPFLYVIYLYVYLFNLEEYKLKSVPYRVSPLCFVWRQTVYVRYVTPAWIASTHFLMVADHRMIHVYTCVYVMWFGQWEVSIWKWLKKYRNFWCCQTTTDTIVVSCESNWILSFHLSLKVIFEFTVTWTGVKVFKVASSAV